MPQHQRQNGSIVSRLARTERGARVCRVDPRILRGVRAASSRASRGPAGRSHPQTARSSVDNGVARESRRRPAARPREGLPPQVRRERSRLRASVSNERDALQLVATPEDRGGGARNRISKPKGFLPRPAPDDAHDTAGTPVAAARRAPEVAAALSRTTRSRTSYTGQHESLTGQHGSDQFDHESTQVAAGLTPPITSRHGSNTSRHASQRV